MHSWSSLLIVAATCGAHTEAPSAAVAPLAKTIYRCDFEETNQKLFKAWTRDLGPGFPRYIPVDVSKDDRSQGANALRISANGGSAAVTSPMLPIRSKSSYTLRSRVRLQDLHATTAVITLSFYNEAKERIASWDARTTAGNEPWSTLEVGPVTGLPPEAQFATIRLEALAGYPVELAGAVWWDEITLDESPSVTVTTDTSWRLFTTGHPVDFAIAVSDWPDGEEVHAEIIAEDVSGNEVARETLPLHKVASAIKQNESKDKHTSRRAAWSAPIDLPGFYRIRVAISGAGGVLPPIEKTLAIVDASEPTANTEFGWSVAGGDSLWKSREAARLYHLAGVRHVKIPVGLPTDKSLRPDLELRTALAEMVSYGVEPIGVLSPPEDVRAEMTLPVEAGERSFTGPKYSAWRSNMELTFLHLATRVRQWEFGAVGSGEPDESQQFAKAISANFAELGVSADVSVPVSGAGETIDENGRRCTLLRAPSMSNDLRASATALLREIIAMKQKGADAIYLENAHDPACGIVTADGGPGPLFMTWRMAALHLGGAKYEGSLALPNHSENLLFSRGGEWMMVVWNDVPCDELIELGPKIRQIDAWGISRASLPGAPQGVHADATPSFVTGLDSSLARLRLSFAFETPELAAEPANPIENSLSFINTSNEPFQGKAKLRLPEGWRASATVFDVRAAAGEPVKLPFTITLPMSVLVGKQRVEVDFTSGPEGSPDRAFTIHNELAVTSGDVQVSIESRRIGADVLELVQTMRHEKPSTSTFRCQLLAPGRRSLRAAVPPFEGEDRRVYRLENPEELRGKTLVLRVEELDGPRVFNYAYEPPDAVFESSQARR